METKRHLPAVIGVCTLATIIVSLQLGHLYVPGSISERLRQVVHPIIIN